MLKFDPQVEYSDKLNKLYISNGFKTSGINPDHDELIQPVHEAVLNVKNKSYDELMKNFAEKTRYNIRLSARKGVTVRHSHTEEDLKVFYHYMKLLQKEIKLEKEHMNILKICLMHMMKTI